MSTLAETQVNDCICCNQKPHECQAHKQHGQQRACALEYCARLFCEERAALILRKATAFPSILTEKLECRCYLTRRSDLFQI